MTHAHDEFSTTAGLAKLHDDGQAKLHSGEFDYTAMNQELKAVFASGKTKSMEWRRQQLQAIQRLVKENHEEITAAVRADHGGPKMRGIADLGPHIAATEALQNLDKWTADEVVPTPMTVSATKMGKSYIRKEPKGVILIIGPWNFPVELVLHPLVCAISAGNCAVIKPSEVAKNCEALVERLVNKYMDTSCIKVVRGAVPETAALLKQPWDHIFYTGNGHVGRIVLRAAAEHLTPVTLELGGKSPVIVDKSAKMKSVVERISAFKYSLNVGQICVAPDYVLIHKDREQEFIDGMKKHLESLFGKDAKKSPHYGRIINSGHVERIGGLLKGTKGKTVTGGIEHFDPASHYIPPTVVQGAQMGEPLLTEEIFGPVLPVMAIDNVEEAVDKVNSVCHQPLALYVFSEDKKVTDYVLNHTTSGGACVNTSMEHVMNTNLPFGGVGASGYGAYHGKAGFDECSHRRSVLDQDTMIMSGSSLPPHPTDTVYDIAVKVMITGFLTDSQKKMAKIALGGGAIAVAGGLLRSRL